MTDLCLDNLSNNNKKLVSEMVSNNFFDTGRAEKANKIAGLMTYYGVQQNLLMPFLYVYDHSEEYKRLTDVAIENQKKGEKIRFSFKWSAKRAVEECVRYNNRLALVEARTTYKDKEFPNFRNGLLHPTIREFIETAGLQTALIETPIRLAAEGYWQSHCVGGRDYINNVGDSQMAFVSIIANKKRWTCQIGIGSNGKMAVVQVLGKNNAHPDERDRKAIDYRLSGKSPMKKYKFSGEIKIRVEDFEIELPEALLGNYGLEESRSGFADLPGYAIALKHALANKKRATFESIVVTDVGKFEVG